MKHMKIEEREIIESMLKQHKTFTEIGERIGYHRTTIANEIIKHRIIGKERTYGTTLVNCKYEDNCDLYTGVGCEHKCERYVRKECAIIMKSPYVCNSCNKRTNCKLQKYFYRSIDAQKMYETDLIESRTGLNIPLEIIHQIDTIIAPLIIEKHQTVNQVYLNHPDILCFSKSEFYRLVNLGYTKIKNIDLPRKVSYNRRRTTGTVRRTRKESIIRVNRTYKDYETFIEKHPNIDTIQIDTVEGEKGGKVFLTLTSVKHQLMLIYLLDSQDSNSVSIKFRWIQQVLGTQLYRDLFFCILTDNGKEFYEPDVMEQVDNEKVCNVFYCDPSSPYQKGTCEENHHYIRYYLPKGNCSFNDLTQTDCNLLMSHINSVPREKLNGLTPYESTLNVIGEDNLNKLGVTRIEKDDVSLSPKLLNGKGKKKND